MDIAYKFGAGRYIQAPDALKTAGEEIQRFGKRFYVLGGRTALAIAGETLEHSLSVSGISHEISEYGGYTDIETARRIAEYVNHAGFDVVVGVGGGRIMDFSKAVAHLAQSGIVTIPTSAATCAAYTPMSVMYTREGKALGTAGGNFYHDYEVDAVLVDENIMVRQPPRYVVAGVLDSMAKYIEIRNDKSISVLSGESRLEMHAAYTMAKYVYDYLYHNCKKITDDVKEQRLTAQVHNFLYINFALTGFISGCSKALGQTALAHELYYVCRMFFTEESLSFLHGEIVGTGLILQLYYNSREEEAAEFKEFMQSLNMPVTLGALGIPETEENKEKIFRYLLSTQFVEDTEKNRVWLQKGIEKICGGE